MNLASDDNFAETTDLEAFLNQKTAEIIWSLLKESAKTNAFFCSSNAPEMVGRVSHRAAVLMDHGAKLEIRR